MAIAHQNGDQVVQTTVGRTLHPLGGGGGGLLPQILDRGVPRRFLNPIPI